MAVPLWKIHRHIGMGGDQLIESVAGKKVESEQGEDIRTAHGALYLDVIDEVGLLSGARELIKTLRQHKHTVVLASSAKEGEVDHYLDLLEARDMVDSWTTSADVEATKPEPDLIKAALDKLGKLRTKDAIMVGDTVWDCIAAKKAGVPTIGVLSGGVGEAELLDAGAVKVYESVQTLARNLSSSPFAK